MKISKVLISALVFGSLLLSPLAMAQQSSFIAGEHYEVVSAKESDEPIVEEFFNYACSHCYTSEKLVEDIKAANPGVTFKAIPLELNPAWKVYVKAYFIGEKLGVLNVSHKKIFHLIHVQNKAFRSDDDMKDFFLSIGVTEKDYDDVAKSYWLDTQVRMSKQYAMKNKVMSTPAFLVNQRYRLDAQKLGTTERIIEAVSELSGSKSAPAAASE